MVNDAHGSPTLENLFTETRTFPPLVSFAAHANATAYEYKKAAADRLGYWREEALRLAWKEPFTEVLDWSDAPVARWFSDGTLNACDNAVDRHIREGRGDRIAFHFEGEPGDTQTLTYNDIFERVQKAAGDLWGYQGKVVHKPSDEKVYLTDNPNRRCPVIQKARTELGYAPEVDADTGIRRTLNWYWFNRQGELA